jgi:hypothetical protein
VFVLRHSRQRDRKNKGHSQKSLPHFPSLLFA